MASIYDQSSVLRICLGLLAAVVTTVATMVLIVFLVNVLVGPISLESLAAEVSDVLEGMWIIVVLSLVVAVPTALFGGMVLWFLFCERGWIRFWQTICGGAFLGLLAYVVIATQMLGWSEIVNGRPLVAALFGVPVVICGAVGGATFWFIVFRRIVDPKLSLSQRVE